MPLAERLMPVWRRSWFWLAAQALLLLAWLAATGGLATTTVVDSESYAQAPPFSVADQRTPGYPLLLRALEASLGTEPPIAACHWLLYLGAVLVLGATVRAASGSDGLALALASPLLYARLLRDHGSTVLPEAPAAAFALLTLASLVWALQASAAGAPAGRSLPWCALAAALLATCLLRPSYLFLLLLVPLAGLAWLRRDGGPWTTLRRPLLALMLASWLPFLAWSTLRWVTVGHFGLVSSGGLNAIGVTASMLTPRLVRELPPEDRRLARFLLERRKQLGLPLRSGYDYARWSADYNTNVWEVAVRAAGRLERREGMDEGRFWVRVNARLGSLSWALLQARPGLYLRWVWDAFRHGLLRALGDPLTATAGLAWLVALGVTVLRRGRDAWQPVSAGLAALGLAGAWAGASLLLVALVEVPLDRYVFAAGLLLPSGFAAATWELVRREADGRASDRVRRLLGRPGTWLGAAALAVFAWHLAQPGFATVWGPDSKGYVWSFARHTLESILAQKRTFGYPLFLAGVDLGTGSLAAVAAVQLALFLGAAVALGLAVGRWSGRPRLAVATTLPLFVAPFVEIQARQLMNDLLAAALAVGTLAALFVLLQAPARRGPWLAVGLLLFLTYQVRPAYLFLLALVPLLGVALGFVCEGSRAGIAALRRLGLPLVLVAALPFLAWCTLRWAVVGHFGLVAVGGANIIGITAQMAEPEVLPALPPGPRALAEAILAERAARGLPGGYAFGRWREDFNLYAHHVAFDALRRLDPEGPDPYNEGALEANAQLVAYSKAIVRARTGLYLRWMVDAARWCWQQAASVPLLRWTALGAGLALVLLALRRLQGPLPRETGLRHALGLLGLAVAYGAASLLLVFLVEAPIHRYLFAALLLLPSACLGLVVEAVAAMGSWARRGPTAAA